MKAMIAVVALVLLCGQPLRASAAESVPGASQAPFTVGVLAFRSVPETLERWQPLADYLSTALDGRPVTLIAADYPELTQAIRRNKVDFVLTNPSHFIELRSENFLSGALATLITKEQGHVVTGFGGVVVVRSDRDDLVRLEDLRGKTIAAVSDSSLGGYRAQAMVLAEHDVQLLQEIKLVLTGMPHDKAVMAVLSGSADAGFIRTGVIEQMITEGRVDPAQIRVLEPRVLPGFPFALTTRLYPEWPFVALTQVDAETARKVAAALYLFAPDSATAEHIGVIGFGIPADYRSVEELARTLRLPPYDQLPVFGVADIWQRFRFMALTIAMVLLIMAGLVLLSVAINRHLRLAKQQLDIQNTRLTGIIEGTGVGTWEWNIQTGETIFNERWAQIIGYSLAELEPVSIDTWIKFAHPEDLKTSEELLQQHFTGESDYYECECRMRHRDGSWVWVLDRGRVISRTNEGNPLWIMGTHLDITERKQSTEALRLSEEHNRALLQALPDLILLLSDDGVLLDVHTNEPEKLLLPPDEFLNRHLREVVPFDVATAAQRCIAAARQNKSVEKHEYVLEMNGREFYYESRIAACSDHSCLAVIRDITQNKHAEQALQQKTVEMEEFVYIVSHDLKSPLVTIKSFLALLRCDQKEGNQQQIEQSMAYIEGAADKMDHLLAALLDYSRAGTTQQHKKHTTVDTVVTSCIDVLAGALRQHQVEIKKQDIYLSLYGDVMQFGQIWQNLIENAIKYKGDQAHPRIDIGVEQRADDTCFYVRDNGMGIAPEQQTRIFSMFTQLHPDQPGIGLGLALVKKVVGCYDGRIWVESAGAGQGSCFWFTLPRAIEPAPGAVSEAPQGM